MKHQIVGIIVILIITTTVAATTNFNTKKDIQITGSGIEVPNWEIGDSWTYNEHYLNFIYKENGRILNLWYHNCTSTYIVTDTIGDNYTVKMTSINNKGSQITSLFGINFLMKYTPFTKLTGEFILKKTDLSYLRISRTESGFVFQGILKIPLYIPWHWNMSWLEIYSPSYIVLPFPLIAGTTGTLANFSWVVHEVDWLLWGLIGPIYPFPDDLTGYSGEQHYSCEMAQISVPAGTYDAYNISIEYMGKGDLHICSYYTSKVGWLVKHSYNYKNATGKTGFIYKCELVSTTYTP